MFELAVFLISVGVGGLGGLLGIGGGVFIIPIFTTVLGVPIKAAIGASLLSVIATSSAAGAAHVGHGVAHVRLGMVLEVATTLGAIAGGLVATSVSGRWLEGGFAVLLVGTAISMRRVKPDADAHETGLLDTRFREPATGRTIRYGVRHLPGGMSASFLAGGLSGLLGIGGGVVKVPLMTLVMGVPLRAAIATSNFMIGVTAATSALIYLARGYIEPSLAVPTALGVLVGAALEPRLVGKRVRSASVKRAFQLLLVVLAVQMIVKAVRG